MILIYHSTGKMMSRFHRTELPSFLFVLLLFSALLTKISWVTVAFAVEVGSFPSSVEIEFGGSGTGPLPASRRETLIKLILDLLSLSLSLFAFLPFRLFHRLLLWRVILKNEKKIKLKGKKKERKAIFIWRIFTICVESRIVYHLLEGNDSGDGWHHHMRRSKSN